MHIKKLHLSELNQVVELFDKYRIFYKQSSDISLAKAYLKERLKRDEAIIFLAFEKKEAFEIPIGFTLLYAKFSSVFARRNWHIGDLYVEPEYRKIGIGEQLLKTAVEFAELDNSKYISLNTADDNFKAQNLYEKHGFVKREQLPNFFYYQLDLH